VAQTQGVINLELSGSKLTIDYGVIGHTGLSCFLTEVDGAGDWVRFPLISK